MPLRRCWTSGRRRISTFRRDPSIGHPVFACLRNPARADPQLREGHHGFRRVWRVFCLAKSAGDADPLTSFPRSKTPGWSAAAGRPFPTGIKWEGAANAPGDEKYVICNADESEPGTFKDRILLLDDPHIPSKACALPPMPLAPAKGYIYLRGEYPYILPVLENALTEARAAGYLGAAFDIEIRMGAGAYICGEETALFESIEGKRGFPRVKPPFPTTLGSVWQADRHQQRRDALQRASDHRAGRGRVPHDRHGEIAGAKTVLRFRGRANGPDCTKFPSA